LGGLERKGTRANRLVVGGLGRPKKGVQTGKIVGVRNSEGQATPGTPERGGKRRKFGMRFRWGGHRQPSNEEKKKTEPNGKRAKIKDLQHHP